ncbi:DNA polymerase III epsilon subunit [hydrothermal vent metagenome]|uniref:DNA polymerase III subunit epsilon n=1 Tax=hydrothermal vent metagenome TaxID=652676 RepID=A0A3B0RD98_9ZZZZ
MRQIVFDLETTGFKFSEGHRIVEIGAIELINGAVTGKNFHIYVNPERDMPDGAFRVHGLSQAFLADKPSFADEKAAPAFCAFIGDDELIAHNGAGFDMPFLQAELKAAGLPALGNRLFDTLHLARRKFPGAPASLDALCSRFGIDTDERKRDGHGALLDSRLLAEVYIELTGGAQAGLNFAREENGDDARSANGASQKRQARMRPTPLAPRITEAEKDAHEAFLADLGVDSLWRTPVS